MQKKIIKNLKNCIMLSEMATVYYVNNSFLLVS